MLKVQEIRELIKLVDESSISDFSYEANGTKVSMKKENGEVVQVAAPQVAPAVDTKPEPQVETKTAEPKQEAQPKEEPKEEAPASTVDFDHEIVSPMVGTFYESPSPEDDPYVQVGDNVDASTVVCIVEAMKLFNEIEAETKGEIVEILVDNGELVEYGQPLFRVKKK
ncbi:acetyl-CoA carboxylase biotin carboxyl carrier protein [Alkalibacillus haloalkaliphilus]|uniref:Biotin carboxyl carrier protein of acetyl-CoA carboxylase n=1 Tax=Alkalibacillus haloalkaliphilus TaxID=94136 RepID=A0A511W5G5_9BACI|nr:acetyl-CoA carboxylase biotin carboxyl carrier protein [Alkalibacillus haloalkaliphilus]GEN45283.1 acetyl-CoA carboxylase, biotin carboxyl carrier protein [Alkalibacillus haloalkaliphilus]